MPYVNHAKTRKVNAKSPEQQEVKRKRRAKGAANYLLKEAAKKSGSTHSGLERKVLEGSMGEPKNTKPKVKFKGAV